MQEYGIVDGEHPRLLHRLSAISGLTKCGQPIVLLPRAAADLPPCQACVLFDQAPARPAIPVN
jgi:hypothetical protein